MSREETNLRPDQQPDLDALSVNVKVHAEYVEGEDRIAFLVEVTDVPPSLLGVRMRLALGPVTVMTFTPPARPTTYPLRFGPTRLDHASVVLLTSHGLTLRPDDAPVETAVTVCHGTGEVMEAMTLPDEDAFFERIQLHHSRFRDPRLLVLGARASFPHLTSFEARCAALTVVAHRLLEANPAEPPSNFASALADWVMAEGDMLAKEGAARLAQTQQAAWSDVRWTVSLATVCALLSLRRDDIEGAHRHFGIAADQTHHVSVAPVSALNLVNACLFKGLMLAMDGRMDDAREHLERGVKAFPPCVAAQDVMLNVWVIGDLINVAHASRLCFIALARCGLLPVGDVPKVNENSKLELGSAKSPVARILAAGHARRLAEFVVSVSGVSPKVLVS
ncbi:hypothetical protein [Roseococcus suduntuyensis]|uniref:Tetratricopeptide repeat-containing protein n=1 Tax=Roseococcus suduntuyensis TaxID=455361 RepID=A0A840AAF3_9PROT|nr:hypothetical protein [Roseococcus suduntuyensis]MBB3897872.1 hypothetical protein [Roseococcus suduntuyensis]